MAPGAPLRGVQRVGGLEFWDGWTGGNCGEVSSADGREFEVALRPDAGSPRHRLWFHFRVGGGTRAGQRVIISVVNMSKQKSLFKDAGMSPATRRSLPGGGARGSSSCRSASTSSPASFAAAPCPPSPLSSPFPPSPSSPCGCCGWGSWERVPPKDCFYYRSKKQRGGNWALSFVVTFERDGEEREFAYSFPYAFGEGLLPWLAMRERADNLPFFRRELLCLTPRGNRADLVTIADPLPDWGRPARPLRAGQQPRRVVFVTARVHPGETPASHVTHGLMEFLLSGDPDAQFLRRRVVFVFVPVLNPDGVEAGNYRTDGNGSDLNRMWQNPSAEEEPTLWHTKRAVHEIAANPNFSLDIFIDVHSHSTSRRSFVFYNPVHPSKILAYGQMERILRLPKLLARSMREEFSMAACRCENEASKAGCARQVIGRELPDALSYTLEVSFFHAPEGEGDSPPGSSALGTGSWGGGSVMSGNGMEVDSGPGCSGGGIPHAALNTLENYSEMGAKLGRSFIDFYELPRPARGEGASAKRDFRWNSSTRTQDLASARISGVDLGVSSGRSIGRAGGGGLLAKRAERAALERSERAAAGGGAGAGLAPAGRPPRSPSKGLTAPASTTTPLPFAGVGAPLRKCVSEVQVSFREERRARRPRRTKSSDELELASTTGRRGSVPSRDSGRITPGEPKQGRSLATGYRAAAGSPAASHAHAIVKRKKTIADGPRMADMAVTSSRQGPRPGAKGGAAAALDAGSGRGALLPRVKKSKPLVAPEGASGTGAAACRLQPHPEHLTKLTKEEVHGQALLNQWGVDIRHPYRVQKSALPMGFKASALPRPRDCGL